jgi:hypothetical protein
MSITPNIVMICIDIGATHTTAKRKEIPTNQNNQPKEMCVLMATRKSRDKMSRMFTEYVCMDFEDQPILALVKLLRRDALIGRLQIGARYSTKYSLIVQGFVRGDEEESAKKPRFLQGAFIKNYV